MFGRWWRKYPVISKRSNGDRLVGIAGPFAEKLYAAGTPPVHGLAKGTADAERVAAVRIGDELSVIRDESGWRVMDDRGALGRLRWRPSDDGRVHAQTGVVIRLPGVGTLRVERVVVSPSGVVVDIGGTVTPAAAE